MVPQSTSQIEIFFNDSIIYLLKNVLATLQTEDPRLCSKTYLAHFYSFKKSTVIKIKRRKSILEKDYFFKKDIFKYAVKVINEQKENFCKMEPPFFFE